MIIPHSTPAAPEGDQGAERWREAAQLRRQHTRWVIIWLAPACEFRAYGGLPGTRRDATVAAATADDLAAAMTQAEQDAPGARGQGQARP